MRTIFFIYFLSYTNISYCQFQKRYGINYHVQGIHGLKQHSNVNRIMYSYGRCMFGNTPTQLTPALLTIDSLGEPVSSYLLRTNSCDTFYNFKDLEYLGRYTYLVGGIVKDTFSKAAVYLFDELNINSNGYYFQVNSSNTFDQIVADTINSAIYISGHIDTTSSTNVDNCSFLCKFDTLLNIYWSKILTYPADLLIKDFKIISDGSIICCANFIDLGGTLTMILFKMDSYGNLIWSKKYEPGNYYSSCNSIILEQGNIFVSGNTIDTSSGNNCTFLMKLDTNGLILWCAHYDFFTGNGSNLLRTMEGGFILTNVVTDSGITGLAQIKIDSLGYIEWNSRYSNTSWNITYYQVNGPNGSIFTVSPSIIPGTGGNPDTKYIYLINSKSNGISGCYESNFPIVYKNYNNFNIANIIINVHDTLLVKSNFTFVKDSINLIEDVLCSTISINEIDPLVSDVKIVYDSDFNYVKFQFNAIEPNLGELIFNNIEGKVYEKYSIRQFAGFNEFKIDISKIKSGIYFLRYQVNGYQVTKKILKFNLGF